MPLRQFHYRDALIKTIRVKSLLLLLAVIVPLVLTLFAWKITKENIHARQAREFEALASENEKALLTKLNSYKFALLGAAGFVQGSDHVSSGEWRTYMESVDIKKSFPGMNGIGLVLPVEEQDLRAYVEEVRREGLPDFRVHPETQGRPYNIITYIEPMRDNAPALGLNTAYEDNRLATAELSRDMGYAAITKKVTLIQSIRNTPGFLLFYPIYKSGMPLNTVDDRRAAHTGWVYGALVAKNFLSDLTQSQTKLFNVRIYDECKEDPEHLIYNSNSADGGLKKPKFSVRKKIKILHQNWLVVWESTPEYQQTRKNNSSLYILVGGLLFTSFLTAMLLITAIRHTNTEEWIVEERKFILPVMTFIIAMTGVFALYDTLTKQEREFLHLTVDQESKRIVELIGLETNEKFLSIMRMAKRWNVAGGTPYPQWQEDARNYVDNLTGLRAVEWVDNSYHIRWAEPVKGNEQVIDMNILFDEQRKQALNDAVEKGMLTITPPLDLVQGYPGFLVYAPLQVKGEWQGFIVGVFSIDEFVSNIIKGEVLNNYAVSLYYRDEHFFRHKGISSPLEKSWSVSRSLRVYDREWTVKVTPTREFIQSRLSPLPKIVLVGGLLLSLLTALALRYILVSRVKSRYLKISEETFRSAMEYAPIGMALVDMKGGWLKVNQALCSLLGYSRAELLNTDFQSITHPEDLAEDLRHVEEIQQGKVDSYQIEKRYFRKDGAVIWVLLSVSMVKDANGAHKYFIAQIQDITQQREMDRIKSEFISIVSHELRTPLTSIRGSLGLILGAMANDIPEKIKRLIQIAHENSERLILLINDILDIDKIASGNMHFDIKSENLESLLHKAADVNQPYADKFNVRIKLLPVDPAMTAMVDAARLTQVLSNFLSNAVKYSHSGGTVELSAAQVPGGYVRISVRDYGSGIPEEFRSRIFGRFSQADSSITRQKGGSGLGLNISKDMVENMKGRIGFDSEVGEGTTFWVEFPDHVATQSVMQPVVDREVPTRLVTRNLPKILHVEDDNSLVKFFADALQDKAEIAQAHTLKEAWAKLKSDDYSLLILDMILPDGSGTELLSYLHETGYTNVPVVILSAVEAPQAVKGRVSKYMVKSRMSETKIIEEILAMIEDDDKVTGHD